MFYIRSTAISRPKFVRKKIRYSILITIYNLHLTTSLRSCKAPVRFSTGLSIIEIRSFPRLYSKVKSCPHTLKCLGI